jgi:hypothetical protein
MGSKIQDRILSAIDDQDTAPDNSAIVELWRLTRDCDWQDLRGLAEALTKATDAGDDEVISEIADVLSQLAEIHRAEEIEVELDAGAAGMPS